MTVTVVLADDHAAIRAGLRLLLESSGEVEVIGEAADGAAALRQAKALRPDVVIMDVRMPRVDGIAATAHVVAETDAAVLVLTTFDLDDYVLGALAAGASGFLLKSAGGDELIRGVQAVAAGDAVLDPKVTRAVITSLPAPPTAVHPDLSSLTGRERDVLAGLGAGLSNYQIARRLEIGEATVKTHVSRVLMKLGVQSRVQAAVIAAQSGLEAP
ncbi:Two component transcriptional regulator, LuxR family OS=Tsukamurella paurometabola (strain ATCC 8368/ DSM / CCUG 35730 / CIP 100753 / JCM 10117 / KCTC 9821 / NBRC 16120 / NCIMB 702349 / NCTC 13040) OX=521096 GN=Tpau_1874 PE=4 SV=1 [Tsukamurella paurometabola]|uniref:Two component transcriptional regulator, LuxR family n=1 Tax=Tsukamurella paurometabola (strain ATCC 8368 / DSM 20162 / CCUG 35730 / CIP 100753 / JCM 10117 / KCTC 9821 / NBRC 16120 / NCIMB 702349 / NCTC 13040) TaxID=521096 RepID=D5UMZ0_TSUPD|nr:response regulator transcription factor [Tsukamurella paurometabola]ADG78487.1 two component transcriptional regulator, LuxR family [Tsukamurella paurometabola DSM 20162]SUP31869.1 Transcriptional regulatory protein devR (dosR) [Tsukamurella paurometabola]